MRLRHIEVIQALLQTGHLGTAAEWLQLPVAEVEERLREAESQLGFMLFASVRGRLQSTPEARALQMEIAHVYEALEPVQRLASSLKQYLAPPCASSAPRRWRNNYCHKVSPPCADVCRMHHAACSARRPAISSAACCCAKAIWA
jgi:hypothetical protein